MPRRSPRSRWATRTAWPWAATDPSATCGEVEPVVGADDQIGAPSVAGVGLEDPVTVAEEGADPVRLACPSGRYVRAVTPLNLPPWPVACGPVVLREFSAADVAMARELSTDPYVPLIGTRS